MEPQTSGKREVFRPLPERKDVDLEITIICGQRVERVDVNPLSEAGTETAAWKQSKTKAENCPQSQGASLLGGERVGVKERRLKTDLLTVSPSVPEI